MSSNYLNFNKNLQLNLNDVLCGLLILFSVWFGYYYRTIKNKEVKRNVGTAVGILIIFIVSGIHIIHCCVIFCIKTVIILYVDKSICHLCCFVFSILYALFFYSNEYFGIANAPSPAILAQVILTMKLFGIASEVNYSYNSQKKRNNFGKNEEKNKTIALTWFDIFHYSFNYIGVVTGPYFRYQTYKDHLNFPFAEYANWKKATLDKLKYIPLYIFVLLWTTYLWPLHYAISDEFYERSWFYRYWYIWPTFTIFRMKMYIGLIMSECICIMAGLGAYPIFTKPIPGQGPSEKLDEMKRLVSNSSSRDRLAEIEYNFETIHTINPYECEFCPSYRKGLRHWNICTNYYLAVHFYKKISNKSIGAFVTMLLSSLCHGIYLGHFICLATIPLGFILDDMYYKLYIKNSRGHFIKIYEWVHLFLRHQFYAYQIIALVLIKSDLVLRYYNSIYHAGLVFGISLYVAGLILSKLKKKNTYEDKTKNMKKIHST